MESIKSLKDIKAAVRLLLDSFPGTDPEGSTVRDYPRPDGSISEFNGMYSGQYIQKRIRDVFKEAAP